MPLYSGDAWCTTWFICSQDVAKAVNEIKRDLEAVTTVKDIQTSLIDYKVRGSLTWFFLGCLECSSLHSMLSQTYKKCLLADVVFMLSQLISLVLLIYVGLVARPALEEFSLFLFGGLT